MRPGVSLGVLGYSGVSWGDQTDPMHYALQYKQETKVARIRS